MPQEVELYETKLGKKILLANIFLSIYLPIINNLIKLTGELSLFTPKPEFQQIYQPTLALISERINRKSEILQLDKSSIGEDDLKHIFESFSIIPPPDFQITYFDIFILSRISSKAGYPKIVSEFDKVAQIIHLGSRLQVYDIHNYLVILQNSKNHSSNSVPASSALPKIRDQFNAAVDFFLKKEKLETSYKTDLEYIIAKMFVDHNLLEREIIQVTGLTAIHHIIDIIILDLAEVCPDNLKETLRTVLDLEIEKTQQKLTRYRDKADEYIHERSAFETNKRWIEQLTDFKKAILREEFLFSVPKNYGDKLSRDINIAVCKLWLDKLNDNPMIFNSENLVYIRDCIRIYIQSAREIGNGKSNREAIGIATLEISKYFSKLKAHKLFGSILIRLVLGLDLDVRKGKIVDNSSEIGTMDINSVADIIDRGFEYIRTRKQTSEF